MSHRFQFELLATEGQARAGVFQTTHGPLPTPIYAPVGTQATVKALTPRQVKETGAILVLANTYHLYLRPGDELVAELGGLHTFMDWDGPMLTDSGGFQVFSLSGRKKGKKSLRTIDDDGVTFRSHIDGSQHRFTPERVMQIQENLGADIAMVLDECAPPDEREYAEQAMQRTHVWAKRSQEAHRRPDQALFGIVQGGVFPDLREESVRYLTELDFPGYAIGGLSVGESKEDMHKMLEVVHPLLPAHKPRYLMGVGTPVDLVESVARGIDIFDCVYPTRVARNGTALTRTGRHNLSNAPYADDPRPIEAGCNCYTCQHFSRAYLRHLVVAGEMLSATLITIHNLHTMLTLIKDIRQAILYGRFAEFRAEFWAARERKA